MIRNGTRLLAFAVAFSLYARGQQGATGKGGAHVISLCELVGNSKKYLGKAVTTTVRITATKHVTGLWDPACPKLGADLWWQEPEASTPGMLQLDKAIKKFGMGDHPIIATLTGTWMGEQYREHQFIQQPRIVFRVIDAADVHWATKIERRYW